MPFNVKIRKCQGGLVHDLRGLRCRCYFQGFEHDSKETLAAQRKGVTFCGFGDELTFTKISSKGTLVIKPQSIVIQVEDLDGHSIGQTRIHLWDFGIKIKRKLTKLSRPRKCNVQISFEFWRSDESDDISISSTRPKLVHDVLKRNFGNQAWIESIFLQCGTHVLPTDEHLLHRIDDVAIVYGSGASASDHEFPGQLWLTSSRLLFFPDELFTSRPSTLNPPFPFPFQLSLAGVKKILIEKEFECCSCLTSSPSSAGKTIVRTNQLGTLAGYCRARIWGKLPRFCELRAPGDCIRGLELVRREIIWRCAEACFSDIVDHTKEDNWGPIDLVREYARMGAIDPTSTSRTTTSSSNSSSKEDDDTKGVSVSSMWRVSSVNSDFNMCSSYPREIVVPADTADSDIYDSRVARENHRVPVLSWYDQRSKACLIRSAQPIRTQIDSNQVKPAKLAGYLAYEDSGAVSANERYVSALKRSCDGKMYVADLRPAVDAVYNACCKRGGWESNSVFQNIWPTQTLQRAFEEIRPMATARNLRGPLWKDSSESMNLTWLKQTSVLLDVSQKLHNMIVKEGISVLCHCSGGWDRTSQVCSLVKIMADGFYRTLEGFEVLIKTEWISFGHKFAERNHYMPNHDNEATDRVDTSAPVFVQFLDAVSQMIRQDPTSFEFNEYLLVFLAEQCYMDQFGDFLHDSDYDRAHADIYNRTVSIWSYVREHHHMFRSPIFSGVFSSMLSKSKDKKWQVSWPDGPVNVRSVKRGDAPSTKSSVSRVLKFGDLVDTVGNLVVDRSGNEWIRLKGDDNNEWVCVRDRNGVLLSCGFYHINSNDVKLWRGLFLRWHFRSVVSHPVVRCILREGRVDDL
jgi:hypothetical protein